MNLTKILELQALNMEDAKLRKDFSNNEDVKKYLKVKNYRDALKQEYQSLSEMIMNYYTRAEAIAIKIKDLVEEADEIKDFDYSDVDSIELADLEHDIQECDQKAFSLTKELDQLHISTIEISRKITKVTQSYVLATTERDKCRPVYEAFAKQTQAQIDDVMSRIQKQKDAMAESDIALYEEVKKASGKADAFLPIKEQQGAGFCPLCGIDIGPAYQKLTDYTTCPSCHRILYK